MRYHFHEWLAVVFIYHSFGYFSLVEQHEFKILVRKQATLKRILSPNVLELVLNHSSSFGKVQCPDLFCYSPDFSDCFFFCEVKGPKDKIREPQARFFEEFTRLSGKGIRLIRFRTSAKGS